MIIKSEMVRRLILNMIFFVSLAQAAELKSVDLKRISYAFVPIFEEVGNLEYRMWGESFLTKYERDRKKLSEVKKRYLIWGGKIDERFKEESKKIVVSGKSVSAMFFKTIKDEQTKIVYIGVADMTDMKKMTSIEPKVPHEVGGYGVIEVIENKKAPKRYMGIHVGIERLKPAEMYEVSLLNKGEQNGLITSVATWGAGAIAGNGSVNMMNGFTFSGQDEWDGSSGEKWDIDTFDIGKFKMVSDEGVIWSIDPLLQWLYPMGIVVQIDKNE